MTDCPKPCIDNKYARDSQLFNILDHEDDSEWRSLIRQLVDNPIVKNNLVSTSEHDLQFKWDHQEKKISMITRLSYVDPVDHGAKGVINIVKNSLDNINAFQPGTAIESLDLDTFNFVGPWYSDCDIPSTQSIIDKPDCIDEVFNLSIPVADPELQKKHFEKRDELITKYVNKYILSLTSVLQYMLDKIDEIAGEEDKALSNDYFILIRNVDGLKKGIFAQSDTEGAKLVAESWHKDYLWAPAEFSSIIYYKNVVMNTVDAKDYPIEFSDSDKQDYSKRLEIHKFRGENNWKEDINISGADFCLTPNFIDEVGLNYFFSQEEIGNYFRDLFFEFIKLDTIQKLRNRTNHPSPNELLISHLKTKEFYDTEVQDELSKENIETKFKLDDDVYNETISLLNNIFKDLDDLKSNLEKIIITLESVDDIAKFIELNPSITVSTEPPFKGKIIRSEREEEGHKMYTILNNSTRENILVREKDIILSPIDLINAVKKYYADSTKVIKISKDEDIKGNFTITDYNNSTVISTPIRNQDDQIVDSIKMIQIGLTSFYKTEILENIFNLPKEEEILDDTLINKIETALEKLDEDKKIFNSIKGKILGINDRRAIYFFINEFTYLVNFIHFINIYFLKIISKRYDYFHKLNIHIRKIRQNILYINSLIPSYDYEHKTESSEEYIKLDQAITNRGELLIAVKKEDIFKKKRKDIWLKGRILFFSKEHLYVRLEEYTIDDSRKTIYIEDDEELIYLDKSWIPRVHNQIKKYCPYPSNNACAKLNWSDFGQKWKIPLSNLNPAKIATPWYSGPDVFNQDLANFINGDDARGWKQIVKLSKINIAEKINIEAEKRFTLKFRADVSSGNISRDYKLRNNKEYEYENSVGCSPLKYYIPKVKLNDALIWDNKNTIHRSPFMKTNKTVIRSFFNIRFLKQHEYRPHPYISLDMDMSQLM